MRAFVRVVPEGKYDAWIAEQGEQAEGGGAAGGGGGSGGGQTAGAEGEQVFTAAGCGSCHTLAAANAEGKVGPDLDNIEKANAAFIKQSITDPGAVVTEGFGDGIMPQEPASSSRTLSSTRS